MRPVLAFERDEAPAKSAVAAVIRRSAGESEVRYPQFAALPEDRLRAERQSGAGAGAHGPAAALAD